MASKRTGAKSSTATDDRQLFSLRLPRPLHTRLGVLAQGRGLRLNELIVDVLQQCWDKAPERAAVEKLLQTSAKVASSSGPVDE